jgi:iron complex transport system substrate-binding protein
MDKTAKVLYGIVFLISAVPVFLSCSGKVPSHDDGIAAKRESLTSYATQFSFKVGKGHSELRILKDDGSEERFYLFETSAVLPDSLRGSKSVILTPVQSVVCTSTTQIPWFDALESSDVISGFPDPGYIYSSLQRARFKQGTLKDLGGPSGLEPEMLISLNPELVLPFSSRGDERLKRLLHQSGIPLLRTREHLEEHPLGRAEWIRMAGLLLNKQSLADSIFSEVVKSYNRQLSTAGGSKDLPAVLTGIPYGGVWYLPGSRSYASRLFEDAGLKPVHSESGNAVVLSLSLEEVFQMGLHADFWIGASDFSTLARLISSDSRFRNFKSVQNKNVWVYDRQLIPGGGNGYFESAGLRPDLVLRDLNIIRTGSDTTELTYYRRLR